MASEHRRAGALRCPRSASARTSTPSRRAASCGAPGLLWEGEGARPRRALRRRRRRARRLQRAVLRGRARRPRARTSAPAAPSGPAPSGRHPADRGGADRAGGGLRRSAMSRSRSSASGRRSASGATRRRRCCPTAVGAPVSVSGTHHGRPGLHRPRARAWRRSPRPWSSGRLTAPVGQAAPSAAAPDVLPADGTGAVGHCRADRCSGPPAHRAKATAPQENRAGPDTPSRPGSEGRSLRSDRGSGTPRTHDDHVREDWHKAVRRDPPKGRGALPRAHYP